MCQLQIAHILLQTLNPPALTPLSKSQPAIGFGEGNGVSGSIQNKRLDGNIERDFPG
jgi:hypothetical protein